MSSLNLVNKPWCLEQVCASNYEKLFRLIPELRSIQNHAVGFSPNHTSLYLKIIDQSAYTLTIELSHRFGKANTTILEPGLKIRIYLDARLAEVLSSHSRPSVDHAFEHFGYIKQITDYKWRLNYFLERWLDHCLAKQYQFSQEMATELA